MNFFFNYRARIKATLCQLLSPFGQVILNKESSGFVKKEFLLSSHPVVCSAL